MTKSEVDELIIGLLIGFLVGLWGLVLVTHFKGEFPAQIAQAHCEQQGFALGQYEKSRILCYQLATEAHK